MNRYDKPRIYPSHNVHSVVGAAQQLSASRPGRLYAKITNLGPDILWIGGDSSVSVANGFPVYVNTESWPIEATEPIWAISSGTSDVRMFEEYP